MGGAGSAIHPEPIGQVAHPFPTAVGFGDRLFQLGRLVHQVRRQIQATEPQGFLQSLFEIQFRAIECRNSRGRIQISRQKFRLGRGLFHRFLIRLVFNFLTQGHLMHLG